MKHHSDNIVEPDPDSVKAGYELADAKARIVVGFLAILAVSMLVLQLGLWWMFDLFYAREIAKDPAPSPLAGQREPPPGPQLEENPGLELHTMLEAQKHSLNEYAWVDREGGIARIPVSEAMMIVAEQLPVRDPNRPRRTRYDPPSAGESTADQAPAGESTDESETPAEETDLEPAGEAAAQNPDSDLDDDRQLPEQPSGPSENLPIEE